MEILIGDIISPYFGVTPDGVREKLEAAAAGQEITVLINSPGGHVYAGIAIFNMIREAAKKHKITVKITGLAASAAGYIALAARAADPSNKIIAMENSVYSIHNPYQIVAGDWRDMAKGADYLKRLAAMFADTYARISGKNAGDVARLMDEETYYIGEEIQENGWATDIEKINAGDSAQAAQAADRTALIETAQGKVFAAVKSFDTACGDYNFEQAAALLGPAFMTANNGGLPSQGPPSGLPASVASRGEPVFSLAEKPTQGANMDIEALKKNHAELYAGVLDEGRKQGAAQERERAEAHLKMGEETGATALAAKYIREGNSLMENKVQAEYMSARMNNFMIAGRDADNPPPIGSGKGAGADAAAFDRAWADGLAGRPYGGDA